MSQLPRT
jgi:hypothetical protein